MGDMIMNHTANTINITCEKFGLQFSTSVETRIPKWLYVHTYVP